MIFSFQFLKFNYRLSNLFYAADSHSIDTLIIDGKIVMEDQEIKSLDKEKIFYEVDKRSLKIAEKLKK